MKIQRSSCTLRHAPLALSVCGHVASTTTLTQQKVAWVHQRFEDVSNAGYSSPARTVATKSRRPIVESAESMDSLNEGRLPTSPPGDLVELAFSGNRATLSNGVQLAPRCELAGLNGARRRHWNITLETPPSASPITTRSANRRASCSPRSCCGRPAANALVRQLANGCAWYAYWFQLVESRERRGRHWTLGVARRIFSASPRNRPPMSYCYACLRSVPAIGRSPRY